MIRAAQSWRVPLLVCTVGVGALACNTQRGWPSRSAGSLGFARFCEGDGGIGDVDYFGPDDEACDDIGRHFAVGSTLVVHVELSEELPDEIKDQGVESASREYLDFQGADLVALVEGEVALLAMGTREAIDYKLLSLHDVDAIEVALPDPVAIGESFAVDAVPFGDGNELSGELDYVWTSLSEGLEVTEQFDRHGRADLLVTAQGEMTLEVAAGGHTERITFNGYAGPSRTRPGGDPEPDPGVPGPGELDTEPRAPESGGGQ
ncbi:MAG: hypothetical protein AAF721_31530 [Myxococcota bacterium]